MRNKNQAFIINTKAKKKILNELLIYNQTSLQEQKYCLYKFFNKNLFSEDIDNNEINNQNNNDINDYLEGNENIINIKSPSTNTNMNILLNNINFEISNKARLVPLNKKDYKYIVNGEKKEINFNDFLNYIDIDKIDEIDINEILNINKNKNNFLKEKINYLLEKSNNNDNNINIKNYLNNNKLILNNQENYSNIFINNLENINSIILNNKKNGNIINLKTDKNINNN